MSCPFVLAVGLVLSLLLFPPGAWPQTPAGARISEEVRVLDTYPFSEPNPVPILTRDPRLYPYHSFEGYAVNPTPREWKVVTLENPFIQVFVLPEVGGKVWGAVVKETGHEFIYRNEVLKFRNIALRGPWTSGGIEFNFGVIGHTPATATPVDYRLVENQDGSVSCWVGGMDLPSRTHWRVEIRLPADAAFFETNVLWYNPTPLEQPYYNWMTAAAFARNDLEMSMPGNAYLHHSGEVESWPMDLEGRYLPLYRNNTFGGHKSYHVVGELHDFFGGYYEDDGYGFGHWARHEDMPGQKLWLWALSPEGGIWEDLLTDTDGQYVEFQAGRLLVQYSPGSHRNPVTQAGFDPLRTDHWSEVWFPLEGLGGLTEASREGALYASVVGETLDLGVNAFRSVRDTLRVWQEGNVVLEEPVTLGPLQPYRTRVQLLGRGAFRVELPALELAYESDPSEGRLSRPFASNAEAWSDLPEVRRLVYQARELQKARQYQEAWSLFGSVLAMDPWNREALLGQGELAYRRGSYGEAMNLATRVLELDTYDPQGNFLVGTLSRSTGNMADARDAFGWAARSMAFRSASYAQLARIMIQEEDFAEAARYAGLALDYDRYSVPAWQALAVVGRVADGPELAQGARRQLLEMDALHHFVQAEEFLEAMGPLTQDPEGNQTGRRDARVAGDALGGVLARNLGGEYPDQTLLELALGYVDLGRPQEALMLLQSVQLPGPSSPVRQAWIAWLSHDPQFLEDPEEPRFTFPYRRETLPVLEWAVEKNSHWIWRYLLALNYWSLGREDEAETQLASLGQEAEFAPLFVARGKLLQETRGGDPGPDLRRAVELEPETRIFHVVLVQHLQAAGDWQASLSAAEQASARFPEDFNLGLLRVRALLHLDRPPEALSILNDLQVLPSENARESHRLWEQAHVLAALEALEAWMNKPGSEPNVLATAEHNLLAALEWPPSLGQGRPYDPEERIVRFLLGLTYHSQGREADAQSQFEAVLEATDPVPGLVRELRGGRLTDRLDLLVVPSLHVLGRSSELAPSVWSVGPPASLAARLRAGFPSLFQGLEGQILSRSLSLVPESWDGRR